MVRLLLNTQQKPAGSVPTRPGMDVAGGEQPKPQATATDRRRVAEARTKSSAMPSTASPDGFSGEAKDHCVAKARARFGK